MERIGDDVLVKRSAGGEGEAYVALVERHSRRVFAVDVFATAGKCGYDIRVLKEYTDEANRFGILLVE